ALAHGLQACWSTPIFSSEGKVLGSFAVLSREPSSPSPQHKRIIAQVTHLAAVAIERKRREQELRRSEAYLAEAQRLSLTGSFGWNVSTGEIIWSKETYCILGYDRTVKPNLNLVLDRVPAEDRALVQQIIDRATRDGTDLDFGHRLLVAFAPWLNSATPSSSSRSRICRLNGGCETCSRAAARVTFCSS